MAGARQHGLPRPYVEKIIRDTANAKIQDHTTNNSDLAMQALSRAGYDPDTFNRLAECAPSADISSEKLKIEENDLRNLAQ
jgi:hypothetical protein